MGIPTRTNGTCRQSYPRLPYTNPVSDRKINDTDGTKMVRALVGVEELLMSGHPTEAFSTEHKCIGTLSEWLACVLLIELKRNPICLG